MIMVVDLILHKISSDEHTGHNMTHKRNKQTKQILGLLLHCWIISLNSHNNKVHMFLLGVKKEYMITKEKKNGDYIQVTKSSSLNS